MDNPAEPLDVAAMEPAIRDLRNTDVRWDATLIGLTPTVVSGSVRRLLASGDAAIPLLVGALEDDARFVVAHVLLTLLSGVEYQTLPWNGLAVDLLPDGQAKVDPAQRPDLARRWRSWQQASPRPPVLPE